MIERYQEIPQEFIDGLQAERHESKHRRAGEFMRVASIPVSIVEKWDREGYDVRSEPYRKTVAKLKAEGLDYFLTTDKDV